MAELSTGMNRSSNCRRRGVSGLSFAYFGRILGAAWALATLMRGSRTGARSRGGTSMSVEVRPARVNTFAPEGKDHLLRVVRKERQGFYDLIDSTDDKTWETPTACTEWEVRDVVGHLVDVTEGYIERFTLARAKQPFPEALGLPGMAKLLDSGAKRFLSSSRTQLIARLKESSDKLFEILDALSPDQYTTEMIPHVYMGPLPTMIYPAFQLIDYSVHAWDMRAGLGELKPLSDDAANTLIPDMFIVR